MTHIFRYAFLMIYLASPQCGLGPSSHRTPLSAASVEAGRNQPRQSEFSISIPVVTTKLARGMNFTYDLSYDSSVWYPVIVNGI